MGLLYVILSAQHYMCYIQQLREKVLPPSQNTVGVCNQITLFIPYHVSSRAVSPLKVTDAPIQVFDILILLLGSNSSILAFGYSFFLLLKCLLADSFDLKILNILHQTKVYAASIRADLYCL